MRTIVVKLLSMFYSAQNVYHSFYFHPLRWAPIANSEAARYFENMARVEDMYAE